MDTTLLHSGLALLANKEVLEGVAAYGAANWVWLALPRLFGVGNQTRRRAWEGLATGIFGQFVQAVLVTLFVFCLLPIFHGGESATLPTVLVREHGRQLLQTCGVAFVTTLGLLFLPLLGAFIATTPGLDAFIGGSAALLFLSGHVPRSIDQLADPRRWHTDALYAFAAFFIATLIISLLARGMVTVWQRWLHQEGWLASDLKILFVRLCCLMPLLLFGRHLTLAAHHGG
jgi:hypothetical protein